MPTVDRVMICFAVKEIMAQYLILFLLAIDSPSSFFLRSLCVTLLPLFMSRPFIHSPATTIIPFLSLTELLLLLSDFRFAISKSAELSSYKTDKPGTLITR